MRRAERLFQVIQVLRREDRPVTAARLAAELEVSTRSIHRDVADLTARRVPIRGEAGLGYVLDPGFDMPPLMLTPDEVEAAVLGARWVAERGDPALALAARDLLAKIATGLPEPLRSALGEATVAVARNLAAPQDGLDVARLRVWISVGRKLCLRCRDADGRDSERTVWPTVVGYGEAARVLIAWCEERRAFRHFRIDRIATADFLQDRHPLRPGVLRARWHRHAESERREGQR